MSNGIRKYGATQSLGWADIVFELHKFEPIELERYRYELIKKELNEYEPVI